MTNFSTIVKEHWLQLFVAFVGVGLMGVGVVKMAIESKGHDVVVRGSEDAATQSAVKKTIVVDVEGAVEKAGVYSLAEGTRIADALTAAGGLAAKADRNYVARFVNKAQLINDGMKIYIPVEGETPVENKAVSEEGASVGGVVNINGAAAEELESLWGVGAARARQIIENRPYATLEELTTKAGVPKNVLDKNAGMIGL